MKHCYILTVVTGACAWLNGLNRTEAAVKIQAQNSQTGAQGGRDGAVGLEISRYKLIRAYSVVAL